MGTDRKRPTNHQELMDYVEWAVPRARQLGCTITKPEARSIGFMHALFTGKEAERVARLEAQKKAAEATPEPEKATTEWLCRSCYEPVFGHPCEEFCIGDTGPHHCFVCGDRHERSSLIYRPVTGAQTLEMQSHLRDRRRG